VLINHPDKVTAFVAWRTTHYELDDDGNVVRRSKKSAQFDLEEDSNGPCVGGHDSRSGTRAGSSEEVDRFRINQ